MKTHMKHIALTLAALLAVSMIVCGGMAVPSTAKGKPPTATPTPPPATGTPIAAGTYYVDCSAGTNGDGSSGSPWSNLATVNGTTFAAGSSILFKRGTTCSGQLWPKGSGASGSPIALDTYGTGDKPIISAGGLVGEGAVKLYNQEYWEIRNLDIRNLGPASDQPRFGIDIVISDIGVGSYYRILNNTVRDVNGDHDKDDPHGGGISFYVSGSAVETMFTDVLIEGNMVHGVDFFGIATWSDWWCRPSANCSSGQAWYGWDAPFIIRSNTVYDIGGDAIVPIITVGAVVEYNVAHDFHNRSNDCAAGMWPWDADDTMFQFNESYLGRLTNSTCDGNGFDIDYGTDGTIVQYNYSHDNEGGFLLMCGPNVGGSTNATVRYNISQDDEVHIFHISGPAVENAQIYNNTIYVPAGNDALIVDEGNWSGYPTSAYFYNNIIYHLGSGGYNLSTSAIQFDTNIFYGNHPASEPDDPNKITDDPLLTSPGGGPSGYQLQAGSPALEVGRVIASNGGRDYFGNTVPEICPPDIGAHQYTSGPFNCPTPTPVLTPTPIAGAMHVETIYTTDVNGTPKDVFSATNREMIYWRVQIKDDGGSPVEGATVSSELRHPSGGTWVARQDVTDSGGWVYHEQRTTKPQPKGTYIAAVTGVVKSGVVYDQASNVKDSHQFLVE